MLTHIKDVIQGKAKLGQKRSNKWSNVRKKFLKNNTTCKACGGKKKLEVHHIIPFNQRPELELETDNLITLCESKKNGVNCHLLFGHLGNYKTINKDVLTDTNVWKEKIKTRLKK